MTQETNFYALLGLPFDATPEDIRHAYREAALRLHPDTNVERGATELFLDVQKAFEILSNEDRRAAYDSSLPANVKKPPEVTLDVLYSAPALHDIRQQQVLYALLELEAHDTLDKAATPPLNVCLLVDCSTSMQGVAMDTVKATAIELVRQVRPQDIFSMVAFSDRAEVLVRARPTLDRRQAENSIHMLQTSGATEIYKGLQVGFEEVRRYSSPNQVNHLILLTDGRTYGDEDNCLRIAGKAASEGIVISALGIGAKWNDTFLDTLSTRTGGSCMYVSMPKDIRHFLKDKLNALGRSYADRVLLNCTFGPGVSARYAMRTQPDPVQIETNSPFVLGSLPSASRLSILLEFFIQGIPEQTSAMTLLEGLITMEIPSRFVPKFTIPIKLERPVGLAESIEMPPFQLMQAVSRMTLYRMQEKIQKDMNEGKVHEATKRLQYLATHLLANGEHDLAKTVMKEATRVENKNGISEEGKKRIKYGTRALLLPAVSGMDSDNGENTL